MVGSQPFVPILNSEFAKEFYFNPSRSYVRLYSNRNQRGSLQHYDSYWNRNAPQAL